MAAELLADPASKSGLSSEVTASGREGEMHGGAQGNPKGLESGMKGRNDQANGDPAQRRRRGKLPFGPVRSRKERPHGGMEHEGIRATEGELGDVSGGHVAARYVGDGTLHISGASSDSQTSSAQGLLESSEEELQQLVMAATKERQLAVELEVERRGALIACQEVGRLKADLGRERARAAEREAAMRESLQDKEETIQRQQRQLHQQMMEAKEEAWRSDSRLSQRDEELNKLRQEFERAMEESKARISAQATECADLAAQLERSRGQLKETERQLAGRNEQLQQSEEQVREASGWVAHGQELEAQAKQHGLSTRSLHFELQERAEHYNQLYMAHQLLRQQFADSEHYYIQLAQQLQRDNAELHEMLRLPSPSPFFSSLGAAFHSGGPGDAAPRGPGSGPPPTMSGGGANGGGAGRGGAFLGEELKGSPSGGGSTGKAGAGLQGAAVLPGVPAVPTSGLTPLLLPLQLPYGAPPRPHPGIPGPVVGVQLAPPPQVLVRGVQLAPNLAHPATGPVVMAAGRAPPVAPLHHAHPKQGGGSSQQHATQLLQPTARPSSASHGTAVATAAAAPSSPRRSGSEPHGPELPRAAAEGFGQQGRDGSELEGASFPSRSGRAAGGAEGAAVPPGPPGALGRSAAAAQSLQQQQQAKDLQAPGGGQQEDDRIQQQQQQQQQGMGTRAAAEFLRVGSIPLESGPAASFPEASDTSANASGVAAQAQASAALLPRYQEAPQAPLFDRPELQQDETRQQQHDTKPPASSHQQQPQPPPPPHQQQQQQRWLPSKQQQQQQQQQQQHYEPGREPMEEEQLLACFVRFLPAAPAARMRVRTAVAARLAKFLVPLTWELAYAPRFGDLPTFLADRPHIFAVDADGYAFLRPGAREGILAAAATRLRAGPPPAAPASHLAVTPASNQASGSGGRGPPVQAYHAATSAPVERDGSQGSVGGSGATQKDEGRGREQAGGGGRPLCSFGRRAERPRCGPSC